MRLSLSISLALLVAVAPLGCERDAPTETKVEVDTPTQAELDQVLEKARADVRAEREAREAAEAKTKAPEDTELETAPAFEAPTGEVAEDPDAILERLSMLNLRGLGGRHRALLVKLLQSEPSACGRAHSLLTSLEKDPSCAESPVIAQWIAEACRRGYDELEIRRKAAQLVRGLQPVGIPTGGRPTYGDARAPVTVVVFADFQCPHCAMEAPRLRRAIDDSDGRAKLVYKHYPLTGHADAARAAAHAEAVLAADPRKWWDFQAWIFSNQRELFADPQALDQKLRAKAEKLGVSMANYDSFVRAGRGVGAVDRDHSDGRRAGVSSTPAVFVNGRRVNADLFKGSLKGWIDYALKADG